MFKGTLGVLVSAKLNSYIPLVKPILDEIKLTILELQKIWKLKY